MEMRCTHMSQKVSPRIWAILSVGIAVVAGLGLLLAFVARAPGEPAPMVTPETPTPADDPVVASLVFEQKTRSITYSFWQEAVLLDQVMSGLAGQPAPAPAETLQRLINEELVLNAVPPEQPPTAGQVEARIAALEQTWGVGDAAVATALEQVGLARAAFEQAVERLLVVEAGLEALHSQGYDTTAWLEEQRASVDIVLNEELEDVTVPHIPVAESPIATPFTSPLPAPTAESPLPSPSPVVATEAPSPTPALAIPEVAPDFTLERATGGTLTLSEQLAQGPVVLVFFQRCG
jgi:hypothetical protein